MKKLLLSLIVILFSIGYGRTQEKFRVDFNYICFFDTETKTWSEWEQAEHTLVFNYNSNLDIIHYTAKGETITYRNLGNKKDDYTNSGKHYQIIDVLDDDGDVIQIQLFDDPEIGMKIIFQNLMVQFAQ